VCVGRDPYDLPVAVVNNETQGIFGELFIQTLDNNTIHKVYSSLYSFFAQFFYFWQLV